MKIASIKQLIPVPKDGQSAISCYLVADYSSIVLDKNGKPNISQIKIRGYRAEGAAIEESTNRIRINYPEGNTGLGWDEYANLPYNILLSELSQDFASGMSHIDIKMYDENVTKIVYSLTIPVVRDGEKGDKGDKGDKGEKGIAGPLTYLAGAWDSSTTYTRSDTECPIVWYNESYWIPKANGSNKGGKPSADSTFWKLVTQEEIVFAKIVMSEFGKIASAIFSGSYMISQYGKLNGTTINASSTNKDSAYKSFDAADPKNVSKFVPNLFLNFLAGKLYATDSEIEGAIKAIRGSIGGFEIAEGRIGDETKLKDSTGQTVITKLNKGAMSLYKDVICFNAKEKQAFFGLFDLLGTHILCSLYDHEKVSMPKCGIQFDIQNSTHAQDFAFAGIGVGALNGFIDGYRFEKITMSSNTTVYSIGDSYSPLRANKIIGVCKQATGKLALPTLKTLQAMLGVDENTNFSFRLQVSSEMGTAGWRLYGRNADLLDKSNNKFMDTDDYPLIIHWDNGKFSYVDFGPCDSYIFELVHDRNSSFLMNGYTTQYTARIINKQG